MNTPTALDLLDPLLTPTEAAVVAGCSVFLIYRLWQADRGPKRERINKKSWGVRRSEAVKFAEARWRYTVSSSAREPVTA